MKFHIPFTFSPLDKLKKKSKLFSDKIKYKKNSQLSKFLKNSNIDISREEYLGIAIKTFLISFFIIFIISSTILFLMEINFAIVFAFLLSLAFSGFIFFSQTVYPKIYMMRRQRDIDKNLISALQDMLVQLDSGVPLFSVLVNVSAADYGELSIEFKKAVRKINAGSPEQEVLESLSEKNPSIYFKRTLWQLSNGMNAGSDMVIVIKDSVNSLNEEQLIQIQNYGNKLNPLIVFYMLISIIIPALSIAFLTIIASMINLPSNVSIILYIGLFVMVVLVQIMFLGLIKSKRPSLL